MNTFDKVGHIIIQNIISPKKWHDIAKSMESEGNINDGQSPGSPSLYNATKLNELHDIIKKKIENNIDVSLYKTYHYFRIYKTGAYLKPHTDRPACEVSVTLNLGGDDWKIGIFDYQNNPRQYVLKPGDALIYHGCDLVHWRPGIFKGKELIQIFLHYVDANGPYAWAKDDLKRQP